MAGNNTRCVYCFAEVVRNYQLHKHTLNRFRYSFTITNAYDISLLHVLPLQINNKTRTTPLYDTTTDSVYRSGHLGCKDALT